MSYSTFRLGANDATKEPMFLGQSVNVARYDQQKYRDFEKLIEKQLSFFWRPEEVDITTDRIDFNTKLQEHERHIFLSNLRYQTLLDSVQGRSPNATLLPLISIPELETWVETWSFSETIHSRSYTHIIRGMVDDPSIVFDGIVTDEEIISRAISISTEYDKLYEMTCARQHWEKMNSNGSTSPNLTESPTLSSASCSVLWYPSTRWRPFVFTLASPVRLLLEKGNYLRATPKSCVSLRAMRRFIAKAQNECSGLCVQAAKACYGPRSLRMRNHSSIRP